MDKATSNKPNAYGKHSKSFWIITYIIAAVIIYGLVYFLFIHKSGSSSGGGFSY